MNIDERNERDPAEPGDALRWQLRALRQDAEPARDLWPGIAARLDARPAIRPPRRWLQPLVLAASLVVAVGSVGWLVRDTGTAPVPAPSLVQREAEGLTRQYQAALQEIPAPLPASLRPTVEQLDRDAALIRAALDRDPDSVRLLEQLRRTYAHRLALAQRLAYT